MEDKEAYAQFCARQPAMPLFLRPQWLDRVVPGATWRVALVRDGAGQIVAAQPYYYRRRYGFRQLTMPHLTPYLGPWLAQPPSPKPHARVHWEKKQYQALLDQWPPYDECRQAFHPGVTNWQPYYWRGFGQTTRYTYVIEPLDDPEALVGNFRTTTRHEIRRAEELLHLEVNGSADWLVGQLRADFARKKIRPLPWDTLVAPLLAQAIADNFGEVLTARNAAGTPQAAAFFVWDQRRAYYLLSTIGPARHRGAVSWLIATALRRAAARGHTTFDFEGSMLETVADFFAQFGGRLQPYFSVHRTPHPLLRWRRDMK